MDPTFAEALKALPDTKSNSSFDPISTQKPGQVDLFSKDDIYPMKEYLNIVKQDTNTTDTCTDTESDGSSSSSFDGDSSGSDNTFNGRCPSPPTVNGVLKRSDEKDVNVHKPKVGIKGNSSSRKIERCEYVSNRLYNRSALMQKEGKERRNEISLRSKERKERKNRIFHVGPLPSSMNENMYYKGLHFVIEREQKKIAIANLKGKKYHSLILTKLQGSFHSRNLK